MSDTNELGCVLLFASPDYNWKTFILILSNLKYKFNYYSNSFKFRRSNNILMFLVYTFFRLIYLLQIWLT